MPQRENASHAIRSPLSWAAGELGGAGRERPLEWIEADGVGGLACGTAGGARTRVYHGWYSPPGPASQRVLVAGCEELVWCQGETTRLSHGPSRDDSLVQFSLDPFPTWRHETSRFTLERSLCLVRERSVAVARYVNLGKRTVGLLVRPLMRLPDSFARRGTPPPRVDPVGGETFRIGGPAPGVPQICLRGPGGRVQVERAPSGAEGERPGIGPWETLRGPVAWSWTLPPGAEAYFLFSREEVSTSPWQLFEGERRRRLAAVPTAEPLFDELFRRSEVFLRDGDSADASVVAGYPDSADRARDSMIALPGLTLAAGRYAAAARVLGAAAARRRGGGLPNGVPVLARADEFDSSDAPLWFILAAEWLTRLRRNPPRPSPSLGAARSILESYRQGALPGIRVEADGLLAGVAPGRALTWMNVYAGGTPVTPREGRAVEVNALWHAALKAVARLERLAGETGRARDLEAQAWLVARRFNETFWCVETESLYDRVGPEGPDRSVRPNQIFAVSLSGDLLPPHRARAVYWTVRRRLLTPFGLRTLDPRDAAYRGRCGGTERERALSAHQGSAWPWLMGAFADAHFRIFGDAAESRREVAGWLQPLKAHIREAGAGSISEIFDGDEPHEPRGRFAEARSVAEIARVFHTYLRND